LEDAETWSSCRRWKHPYTKQRVKKRRKKRTKKHRANKCKVNEPRWSTQAPAFFDYEASKRTTRGLEEFVRKLGLEIGWEFEWNGVDSTWARVKLVDDTTR
jgi:hypothetical protein